MIFIFRLIGGTDDDILEADLPIPATGLLNAVKKLMDFLSNNFSRLVIVSYYYLVQFDDGYLMPCVMSDSFYKRYILEV